MSNFFNQISILAKLFLAFLNINILCVDFLNFDRCFVSYINHLCILIIMS